MFKPKLKKLFTISFYRNEELELQHAVMYDFKQAAPVFKNIDCSLVYHQITNSKGDIEVSKSIFHPDLYTPRGFLKNMYYRIKDTIFPLSYK